MSDLSKNFSKWEFACPHCALSNPDPRLILALQQYRDLLNKPIKITSAGRCIALEGKFPLSQHMVSSAKMSKAVDCIALGPTLLEMYYAALEIPDFMNGGIGIYPNKDNSNAGFLHLDVRTNFARWSRIEGTYGKHQAGLDYIKQYLIDEGNQVEIRIIKQGSYDYDVPIIIP